MNQLSVYVVTINWNGLEDTLECLESLSGLSHPNVTAVVVDNASEGDQADVIERDYPSAVVLRQSENLGFCGGCNVGIQFALAHDADFVMLLNNDTIVPPDLIERLLVPMAQLENVAAVSPVILEHPAMEKIWFSKARWDADEAQFRLKAPAESLAEIQEKDPYSSEFACGCCLIAPAKNFRDYGLLDERYFAFYDEADWCARLRRAGLESYVIPSAVMYHKVSRSTPNKVSTYLLTRNRLLWMKENLELQVRGKSRKYLLREFGWHLLNLAGLRRNRLYTVDQSRAVIMGYRDYFLRRFHKWSGKDDAFFFRQ